MGRGAWQAIVCGVAELDMTEPLTLIHFQKEKNCEFSNFASY